MKHITRLRNTAGRVYRMRCKLVDNYVAVSDTWHALTSEEQNNLTTAVKSLESCCDSLTRRADALQKEAA